MTLQNVNIQNCKLSMGDSVRGIISVAECNNSSSTVVLRNVKFRNNVNKDGSWIFVESPSCYTLKMTDVQFHGNMLHGNPQLAASNTMERIQLTFNVIQSENPNDESFFLYFAKNVAKISNFRAWKNTGNVLGAKKTNLTIKDAIFSGSKDEIISPIRIEASSVSIQNVTFKDNKGGSGISAILLESSEANFKNVHFSNNLAKIGTIVSNGEMKMNFISCTFESNGVSLKNDFGGVITTSNPTQTTLDLSIFNSSFVENEGQLGSAISFDKLKGITLQIQKTRFENNFVNLTSLGACGGAIYVKRTSGSIIVNGSVFESNAAGFKGGAICFIDVKGRIVFDKTRFVENSVNLTEGYGGAVSINGDNEDALFEIFGTEFARNRVTANIGGALYASGSRTTMVVIGNRFVENEAQKGAAIYAKRLQSFNCTNGSFERNFANDTGAAAYVESKVDSAYFERTAFLGNKAAIAGGIYTRSVMITRNCQFVNNSATERGGALFFDKTVTEGNISACNFTNNSAASGGGIYMRTTESVINIVNSTFENNTADSAGGAVVGIADDVLNQLNMRHCLFRTNKAKLGGFISSFCFFDSALQEVHFLKPIHLSVGRKAPGCTWNIAFSKAIMPNEQEVECL